MTSNQKRNGPSNQEAVHTQLQHKGQPIWYCPSRWLLAHHDSQANITTLSSHLCLADLNKDGDDLLAFIDFKRQQVPPEPSDNRSAKPPYECRMRVYRGHQLIYNHFLDDIPSCLLATSISSHLNLDQPTLKHKGSSFSQLINPLNQEQHLQQQQHQQPLLTMPIMDDVYFYRGLKPSFKLSLEDEDIILGSLVKSEVEAWQMVRENKVDSEAMRELLNGLSQELGNQELTSHSLNYLALDSIESRKRYLVSWKLKKFQNAPHDGEHIMSMDTVCCAAARLKFSSDVTKSGDYGQTRENGSFLNNSRWTRILDLQKEGLVVGTEDGHLIIYELRPFKSLFECHYRLPSVPDHILVERRSPANFDVRCNLVDLTYKILVSCRNCRIYSIDQLYLADNRDSPCKLRELVALKCNVVEMSWSGIEEQPHDSNQGYANRTPNAPTWPLFVVACLDRRVYCFSSHTGQCKWVIEVELPITCLVCLPKLQIGPDESSLVGVGSKANRIDFYLALNGRIVDSIYFSNDDYPEAATFGRFGREDNCLCLVSHLGHLVIFILKRTAKFAHGQCLSSAASYASDTLASCGQKIQKSLLKQEASQQSSAAPSGQADQALKLDNPASVPSAFSLSKSTSATTADQVLDSMLQLDHDCDQVAAKHALEAHVRRPKLQIPTKGRDFINQILNQSHQSQRTGQVFASQMLGLRDKVKATMERQSDMHSASEAVHRAEGVNRVMLTQVTGLGNTYRVSLSVRLNLERFIGRYEQLFRPTLPKSLWKLTFLIYPSASSQTGAPYQVKPFRRCQLVERDDQSSSGVKTIFESSFDFKLYQPGQPTGLEPSLGDTIEVQLQVLVSHLSSVKETLIQRPLTISSINVPMS